MIHVIAAQQNRVLPMPVGGDETWLNVKPFRFQFEFVAANPSASGSAEVASKTAPYQLRHASSCCAAGNE